MKNQGNPNRARRYGTLSCLILALLVGSASGAKAELRCGDTVLPGQKVRLEENVGPCTTATGGITVIGPATLDLNGFSINCAIDSNQNAVPVGITVVGERARIKNGRVLACRRGVHVQGTGRHKIVGLTVAFSHTRGFINFSDRSTFKNNQALNNQHEGFVVHGNQTVFKKNLAADNGWEGILVMGGARHVVVRNTAIDNGSHGLAVWEHGLGEPNKLIRNAASGNSDYDVYLEDEACTEDLWRKNLYGTKNVDCPL